MATRISPEVPHAGEGPTSDAAMQRPWRKRIRLSSIPGKVLGPFEEFWAGAGFDKGPWLTVAFAAGIGLWFLLPTRFGWVVAIGCSVLLAAGGWWLQRRSPFAQTGLVIIVAALAVGAGTANVWARSDMVGAPAIEYPQVRMLDARILEREEQPARERIRLVLATRLDGTAVKVRVNVPAEKAGDELEEGARIRLRSRLMPPAGPILPGAYDFARAAWFQGLAATGTTIGEISLVEPAKANSPIARTQRFLSRHVRSNIDGSPGSIAAALASGDRGAISEADEEAMRDSGLTHLLSISGLHVSALIGAAYLVSLKLLALFPPLALRVRLPLVAAGIAACAGIGYTLLTGAEVPTVRSCVGALLVLIALAIGREPLSMRMVAIAAFVVLLVWPESVIGPSFQMSFAAVIAIIALHQSAPVSAFLAPREEPWWQRTGRRVVMLFVTGLVIEFALMPIVLFHFHRAGVYGAFANVIAIPLVTFVTMPLLAAALLLDLVGLGWFVWWAVDGSLTVLVGIAHTVAAQPGAVKLIPQMSLGSVLSISAGLLWLALWRGRTRLLGLVPVAMAATATALTPVPDILITRDGRHVGIVGEDRRLLVLRESRSGYAQDNLIELAGAEQGVLPLSRWPAARCNRDFCALTLRRNDQPVHILMSRSNDMVEERPLAAACARSHIVISDRWLPRSCEPMWLKADRDYLRRSGGLAITLDPEGIIPVRRRPTEHGW